MNVQRLDRIKAPIADANVHLGNTGHHDNIADSACPFVLSSVLGSWGAGHNATDNRTRRSKLVRQWQPNYTGTATGPTGSHHDAPNTTRELHRDCARYTPARDDEILMRVTEPRYCNTINQQEDQGESKAMTATRSAAKAASIDNGKLSQTPLPRLPDFLVRSLSTHT